MVAGLGIEVVRMIPRETLLGLLTGAYKLHGGVVRDMSGRIVAHLAHSTDALGLMPGVGWLADAFQTYQLHKMGLVLNRVESQVGKAVQLSTTAAALSGLNLVVSISGFALVGLQLKRLSDTISRIERSTKKTNTILNAVQFGKLRAALDGHQRAGVTSDAQMRQDMLRQSLHDFGQLVHEYPKCWGRFQDADELQALDDGYCLSMIGLAMTASDLGFLDSAAKEFTEHLQVRQELVRAHCRTQVLRADPQRLLHHRYVKTLPTVDLIRLLDFVSQDPRGVDGLDELRKREADAPLLRLPGFSSEEGELSLAMQLIAKDEVLQGYQSHLQYLKEKGVRSCDFRRQLSEQLQDVDTTTGPVWVLLTEEQTDRASGPAEVVPLLQVETAQPVGWWNKLGRLLGAVPTPKQA